MQVVILAGGLATRMRPLSERLPKSLFEVAGRPFLDHQLANLARGGATRALLCVGHMGERIREHVARARPPLEVAFSDDGGALLGTGGAVRRALAAGLLEEELCVTYGDSYLPMDLRALAQAHRAAGTPATMTVFCNEGRWDASNCIVAGSRVARLADAQERRLSPRPAGMDFIDYGMLAMTRGFVASWPDAVPFDLGAPLRRLAADGQLAAHEVHERFYEIGSPRGLTELEGLLSLSSGGHP